LRINGKQLEEGCLRDRGEMGPRAGNHVCLSNFRLFALSTPLVDIPTPNYKNFKNIFLILKHVFYFYFWEKNKHLEKPHSFYTLN